MAPVGQKIWTVWGVILQILWIKNAPVIFRNKSFVVQRATSVQYSKYSAKRIQRGIGTCHLYVLYNVSGECHMKKHKEFNFHPTEYAYSRVPGFYSSRPNWVYPPRPPPASKYCSHPPPFGAQKGRHTRFQGRGWGDPIQTKGRTLWFSMYTITSTFQQLINKQSLILIIGSLGWRGKSLRSTLQ
jgi:hypothetical protein